MKLIDKIKEDLGKISKWPWRRFERAVVDCGGLDRNWELLVCSTEFTPVSNEEKTANADFIAHSPSHMAALVEYYEAAEEWLKAVNDDLPKRLNRLKKARAALEGEE